MGSGNLQCIRIIKISMQEKGKLLLTIVSFLITQETLKIFAVFLFLMQTHNSKFFYFLLHSFKFCAKNVKPFTTLPGIFIMFSLKNYISSLQINPLRRYFNRICFNTTSKNLQDISIVLPLKNSNRITRNY